MQSRPMPIQGSAWGARFRLCGAFLQTFAWLDRLSKSAPHNAGRQQILCGGLMKNRGGVVIMVNHLLQTSHPFSSSVLRFCVSAPSPSSILRTHYQVPDPVSPLLAIPTRTPGGVGVFFPFRFTRNDLGEGNSHFFLLLPPRRYFLASSPFNRLLALRDGQMGEGRR